MPGMDTLNGALRRLDIEARGCSYRHASDMYSGFLAGWHDSPYEISGLKPAHPLASHQIPAREAVLGQSGATVAATAGGLDCERRLFPIHDYIDVPYAGCIERMGFRDPQTAPIPLRAPAGGNLHRQSGGLQRLEQRPARRVDRGRVLQGSLRLRLDTLEPLRIVRQELLD